MSTMPGKNQVLLKAFRNLPCVNAHTAQGSPQSTSTTGPLVRSPIPKQDQSKIDQPTSAFSWVRHCQNANITVVVHKVKRGSVRIVPALWSTMKKELYTKHSGNIKAVRSSNLNQQLITSMVAAV